jgi:ZIP family zinc transporter
VYIDAIFVYALLLSLLAGIATTVGALFAYFIKKPTEKMIWFSLAFSAGVMIQISFVELLRNSIDLVGFLSANLFFIAGLLLVFMIDVLVPIEYIAEKTTSKDSRLMKAGVLTALGIAIHNFPEGFATFAGALYSLDVGILLAIAIAIHNIPEGLIVYLPIFSATGDRKRAFMYSFISGIFEPIGAIIGGLFLLPFLTEHLINSILAFIAGIMVYVSLDELLPSAYKDRKGHLAASGILLGIIVMTISLILLK